MRSIACTCPIALPDVEAGIEAHVSRGVSM